MCYREMKKDGYTIIELIIVIFIMLILFSLGLKVKGSIDKIINDTKVESSVNEISNILSYGKHYCRINEIEGAININKTTGEISLYEDIRNGKVIKKSTLYNGLQFVSDLKIKVTSSGGLQACTIYIKDRYGKVSKITISVGIDNINIY